MFDIRKPFDESVMEFRLRAHICKKSLSADSQMPVKVLGIWKNPSSSFL